MKRCALCRLRVKSGSPAWAAECPLLGVEQTSISGDWMYACSQKRAFGQFLSAWVPSSMTANLPVIEIYSANRRDDKGGPTLLPLIGAWWFGWNSEGHFQGFSRPRMVSGPSSSNSESSIRVQVTSHGKSQGGLGTSLAADLSASRRNADAANSRALISSAARTDKGPVQELARQW